MNDRIEIESVRPAQAANAAEVAALINTAFQVEKFFVDGDRITEEEVRTLLDKGWILMAHDSTGMAGCVYVEAGGERGYLGLLSVSPARQGAGVGRLLVAAAEDRARQSGCMLMDLRIVSLRSSLTAFYKKLGYRETGVAPFPEGVSTKLPCHFITMSKQLT